MDASQLIKMKRINEELVNRSDGRWRTRRSTATPWRC